MARKRERAFAGFFAILFLVTSSALAIGVIVQAVQNHKQSPAASTDTTKLMGTKMQNFTPTSVPQTQLQVMDTKSGTGAEVKAGDTVTAEYTGALMSNGVVFDASADHGGAVSFPLDGVIPGWSQGIPGMKVGGSRRLLIPASLGYGPQPPSGSTIPANADLVFDVTITKIGK